jgi:hypothetical protein
MVAEEQQDAHVPKQQDAHAGEQQPEQQDAHAGEEPAEPVSGTQQLRQGSELAARVKQLEQELSTMTAKRDDVQLQLHRATKYDLWLETGGPPDYYHLAENYRYMCAAIARPIPYYHGLGPPGGTVESNWEILTCKIRWVSEMYLAPRVPWSSLGPDTRDKLLLWTPKAQQFLDSDDEEARVVFEAWIWHVLDDYVFSNTKGPWVGELWNAYAKLERLGACKS